MIHCQVMKHRFLSSVAYQCLTDHFILAHASLLEWWPIFDGRYLFLVGDQSNMTKYNPQSWWPKAFSSWTVPMFWACNMYRILKWTKKLGQFLQIPVLMVTYTCFRNYPVLRGHETAMNNDKIFHAFSDIMVCPTLLQEVCLVTLKRELGWNKKKWL